MLPLSVVIPTRDCAPLLEGHVKSLNLWIDLAAEVLVVDSNSSDNTVEILRTRLKHPRIQYLTHPPGLYQSWNFGIQNTSSKYVYMATVADSIQRDGVQHLFEVAEKFGGDVAMSKPCLTTGAGEPLPDINWPIDEILGWLDVKEPILLTPFEQFLFASTNTWGALLGSSASNLYSAACLKARPFPTQFGAAGDCAWGIVNAFDVSIAVTPQRFSTFREHEKSYSLNDNHLKSLIARLFDLAQSTSRSRAAAEPKIAAMLEEMRWPELEDLLKEIPVWQSKLEAYRKAKGPWYLNPAAWQARKTRNCAERKIRQITAEVLARQNRKSGQATAGGNERSFAKASAPAKDNK
jgi:hypothetical protein